MSYQTHSVEIAGVHRELRLMEVAPGVRIAVLNILGDTELTQADANALVKQLPISRDSTLHTLAFWQEGNARAVLGRMRFKEFVSPSEYGAMLT